MKLLNTTGRVIFAGGFMLVPSRPLEVGNVTALAKKVPRVAQLMALGALQKVTAKQAKEAEKDFAAEELASLKKAAEDKGLSTANCKTKEDYVALLKG